MDVQLQNLFENLKIEMKKQTKEITDSLMEKMDEKIQPIIIENNILKCELEKLQHKNEVLEKEKKSYNVILFGIQEGEKETSQQLLALVKLGIHELEVPLQDYEINKVHRIGKMENKSGKPRPVVVALTNTWKRNEILKNKKKSDRIYITEDFPKEVLEKRRSLLPQLHEERSKGKFAYLSYDKLIVKERRDLVDPKKRPLTNSPIGSNVQGDESSSIEGPSKINKIDAFTYMRARSYSLSSKNDYNK